MAIRFNATTDELYRTANVINYNAAYTACFWFYNIADAADSYNTLAYFSDDGDFPNAEGIDFRRTTGSTRRLIIYTDNGSFWEALGTTNLSQNTWYFGAIVRQSNYPGTVNAYLGTLGGTTLSTEATLNAQTGTRATASARLQFGTYLTAEVFDGRMAHMRGWSAALSTAELLQEMYAIAPRRTANLLFWLPTIQGVTRSVDFAGNGNFTETALADEDNPPISWGGQTHLIPFVSSGAVQYEQSASGTLTSAGALVNQGQKIFTGATTPTAVLLKQATKVAAGTLTSAGALTKQANANPAGALTTAGALATLRTTYAVLTGTLGAAGSLVNRAGKQVAGALTSSGQLTKQTAASAGGELASAGVLATVKAALLSVGGTLTSSGALVSRTATSAGGSLTSAGTLVKQTTIALAGALTSSGALTSIKAALISVGGTLSSSGALVKQTGRNLAGTLSSAGVLTKRAAIGLGGVLSSAGALAKRTAASLGGVLSSAGAALVSLIEGGSSQVGQMTLAVTAPSVAIAVTAPRVGLAVAAPSVTITIEPLL